jgi:hypothetical protein
MLILRLTRDSLIALPSPQGEGRAKHGNNGTRTTQTEADFPQPGIYLKISPNQPNPCHPRSIVATLRAIHNS